VSINKPTPHIYINPKNLSPLHINSDVKPRVQENEMVNILDKLVTKDLIIVI